MNEWLDDKGKSHLGMIDESPITVKEVEKPKEEATEIELSDHEMIKAIYHKICEGGID